MKRGAYLLNLGIRSAARFETIVVALKVLVVLLVIAVGVFHIDTGNYSPFFPYGVGGAFTGAARPSKVASISRAGFMTSSRRRRR